MRWPTMTFPHAHTESLPDDHSRTPAAIRKVPCFGVQIETEIAGTAETDRQQTDSWQTSQQTGRTDRTCDMTCVVCAVGLPNSTNLRTALYLGSALRERLGMRTERVGSCVRSGTAFAGHAYQQSAGARCKTDLLHCSCTDSHDMPARACHLCTASEHPPTKLPHWRALRIHGTGLPRVLSVALLVQDQRRSNFK